MSAHILPNGVHTDMCGCGTCVEMWDDPYERYEPTRDGYDDGCMDCVDAGEACGQHGWLFNEGITG